MKKLLTASTLIALTSLSQTAFAEEYTVKMVTDWEAGTFYFEPHDLTIASGDTVTWINATDDMHNAVSDQIPKGAEGFESPMLEEQDQTWSHTFETSGTFSYHCHPHAAMGMRGQIMVDQASATDEEMTEEHGHDHGEHH